MPIRRFLQVCAAVLLFPALASATGPVSARAASAEAASLRGGGFVRPVYPEACIMKLVAKRMRLELKDDIPAPLVRYGSETPLQEFQDAIEPQWGMRPDFVLNSYVFALNKIYILDEKDYYDKVGRYVDDSLFHEYVHYFQVKYRGNVFDGDDSLEWEAIDHQTWFRETYMFPAIPAAEACGN